MQYSTIGFQMLGAILFCAWIGNWLDGQMGTSKPYITIIGMLFGVTTSIVLMIRSVQRVTKQQEALDAQEKQEREENS